MTSIAITRAAPATTIHGRGEIGGKAQGLLLIDQMELAGAERLRAEVLTTDFYERYHHDGGRFDEETERHLRLVHDSFPPRPIGVRSSEKFEDNPWIPTSGVSVSYMLPNYDRDAEARFAQFLRALRYIYDGYARRRQEEGKRDRGLAVVVNPIPGAMMESDAGRIFCPLSSGVADSFFKHPLKLDGGLQDPEEGFARVAFGHGYAVVRDDFEVIPLATIRNPVSPRLATRNGQRYFYALPLDRGSSFDERELSTMSMLSMRFAPAAMLAHFTGERGSVDFSRLVDEDRFGYRSGLGAIMEQLSKKRRHFQIEFTWNLHGDEGRFHIVQYKKLREVDLSSLRVPDFRGPPLIATENFQGHGVVADIRHAVVINPMAYTEQAHDEVVRELRLINDALAARDQKYLLVCPGRIGTSNRKWGFNFEFRCISGAMVIVEYGYDVRASASLELERSERTGGIYGSHFLYQLLGGADEAERQRRTRLFGSQGTHFLTNLYATGALYLFVHPRHDQLSSWFFSPPAGRERAPIYVKEIDPPVTGYANLFERRCVVSPTEAAVPTEAVRPASVRPPQRRIINPHKLNRVFVLAAHEAVRATARTMWRQLPNCEVAVLSDPTDLDERLSAKTFVLLTDEGSIPLLDRERFRKHNPSGVVVLLSTDLRVGCAPTRAEVEKLCPQAAKADLVFYVNDDDCRAADVMPAVVRYVEDRHNIARHKRTRRFIFLVVDDELRWFSQFLPVLYRIIGQRACVALARTYEEAEATMARHGSDVVCLITDIAFPKSGRMAEDAGNLLVAATKASQPRIPIIVASKAERAGALRDVALVIPKGDPETVQVLDQYVHDFTGLGDFLFYRGRELWRRVSTLTELRRAVVEAPVEMLEEYADKDYYSTWLYMHGFRELADRLRGVTARGEELRRLLASSFSEEEMLVDEQELLVTSEAGHVLGRARTVQELAGVIQELDAETLVAYADRDVFSMWVMRKGYPRLAARLRPIFGDGEELRQELVRTLARWQADEGG